MHLLEVLIIKLHSLMLDIKLHGLRRSVRVACPPPRRRLADVVPYNSRDGGGSSSGRPHCETSDREGLLWARRGRHARESAIRPSQEDARTGDVEGDAGAWGARRRTRQAQRQKQRSVAVAGCAHRQRQEIPGGRAWAALTARRGTRRGRGRRPGHC